MVQVKSEDQAFYRLSEKGVRPQIWIALIASLLLLRLELRSRWGWSALELGRLVHNLILERCTLMAVLCPPLLVHLIRTNRP